MAFSGGDKFGRAAFQTFMRHAVEIHFRHRSAIRAMTEVSAYDSKVAKAYQEFWQTHAAATLVVLAQLNATGEAHPDAV